MQPSARCGHDEQANRPTAHVEEMVNMITAQRAYEANASAVDVAKNMARSAISIAES